MPWARVTPILLDCPPGSLCAKRYPGHTKGCPNYGKRPSCPPQAIRWTRETIEKATAWYAIWNIFPFGEHIEKMRAKHPDWTARQLANCLYWQGTARKQLTGTLDQFEKAMRIDYPNADLWVFRIPEAHGVNVTATMRALDHELQWPPRTVTYQVALASVMTAPGQDDRKE